jgi:Flp pilus assembly protein TadG
MNSCNINQQKGLYSVEFVLIAVFFLATFYLVFELVRVMYLMNAANEATRRAARLATVCNMNANGIFTEITSRLPGVTNQEIVVTYLPAACTAATCETVTVSLVGATITIANQLLPVTINFPPFTTTLPRESMDSTLNVAACA